MAYTCPTKIFIQSEFHNFAIQQKFEKKNNNIEDLKNIHFA